jgi:glucose-1-phosphate cytidylyltransferase
MGLSAATPKPLLRIGGRPVLDHVIDIFVDNGVREFVVCGGHMVDLIAAWLSSESIARGPEASRYFLRRGSSEIVVELIDTGVGTGSGGRLRRAGPHLGDRFFLTYADGLADVDLDGLVRTHDRCGARVTMTGVPLAVQIGVASIPEDAELTDWFVEKPVLSGLWANVGFQLADSSVVEELCHDDRTNWEADVLPVLAARRELAVHRHMSFWRSMDYPHEHEWLERVWESDGSPWRRTQ